MPALPEVAVGGRHPALAPALVRRVVRTVLRGERRRARVSVTFLGPAAMTGLNRRYLGHRRRTDVIAFGLSAPDGSLTGDVYVCRAAAAAEARRHGVPLREELLRLVVHGTLHVLGWDHPAGEERVRSAMWRRQERYVRKLA